MAWRRKPAGIDMNRNYVTVGLRIRTVASMQTRVRRSATCCRADSASRRRRPTTLRRSPSPSSRCRRLLQRSSMATQTPPWSPGIPSRARWRPSMKEVRADGGFKLEGFVDHWPRGPPLLCWFLYTSTSLLQKPAGFSGGGGQAYVLHGLYLPYRVWRSNNPVLAAVGLFQTNWTNYNSQVIWHSTEYFVHYLVYRKL